MAVSSSSLTTTTKGVTDIQTDVDAKSVVVQADAAVKPEDMLAKLLKVCVYDCACAESVVLDRSWWWCMRWKNSRLTI